MTLATTGLPELRERDEAQGFARVDVEHPTRVRMAIETSRFLVKTAETAAEVRAALRLRHDTFFLRDLGKRLPGGLDIDEFDADSDHLLVIERASGSVIGNYRVRCSAFHERFYSETEFQLGDLLRAGEVKVEIGRACVDPNHRGGAVIQLLWRGLMEYMEAVDARYLFGCSSVSAKAAGQVEAAWQSIVDGGHLSTGPVVTPHRPYPMLDAPLADAPMPSLLATYLKAGAKVLGAPAHDPEFVCADFLTLLDIRELTRARFRRTDA